MELPARNPTRRKLRWHLATLMGAIAGVALVLGLLRPLATPATLRAARGVLNQIAPHAHPGFVSSDFVAEPAVQTASGFWNVRFIRVRGSGLDEIQVTVPDAAVKKARWNPWWKPD